MPKSVPIITDWSVDERLALVREWHPAPVYEVTEMPSTHAKDDQEAWYKVESLMTIANERFDTTKGNVRHYKLTVATCEKELGKR